MEKDIFFTYLLYRYFPRNLAKDLALTASKDKSNQTAAEEAAEAVAAARKAVILRQGAERLDSSELKKAIEAVNKADDDNEQMDDVNEEILRNMFIPPGERNRTKPAEDEIEGNPLNCCESFLHI